MKYINGTSRDQMSFLPECIEDYIDENIEELNEYEIKSASNIIQKKIKGQEIQEIKNFLYKKGYKTDNINVAFDK